MGFKGRDWTELAIRWSIPIDQNEEITLNKVDQIISSVMVDFEVINKEVLMDMREFLREFIKYESYKQPIFEGLMKVEEPNTFIKYYRYLLSQMWNV
ncbi:hypothetical protein [Paenibacillus sp. YIM B09110]|uniref:hypothetical protein n=1 Tax=Paenibacillus sp. YIM B09110 TaxID=3126102 RepID=UPI00301C7476